MSHNSQWEMEDKHLFPHIGQRIIKTTVAVFLCLLIYALRGYRGQDMPTEAAITAIICMQPYVRDSRDYAINRLTGTLIGALWGLLCLLLLAIFPALSRHILLLYAMMALGVLLSLYSAVALRKPDTSSLAAIVFICIVISFPDIEAPLQQAAHRLLDVLVGTLVAIGVNVLRLPREKKRDCVFFVRTKDLVPDRFSRLPAAALFRLNYLYNDGAKICLMTEHAPAFFSLQMNEAKLSVPLIVMDGAAIYDANENRYLHVETIPAETSAALQRHLDTLGFSYFIYTIHHDKTCIFHAGEIRKEELRIYERMKRSPYRSYLEGEIYEDAEIVYLKIITEDDQAAEIERKLLPSLRQHRLRSAIRKQPGAPGLSGLYLYSDQATMRHAQTRLMHMLQQQDPTLRPVEVFSSSAYRTENDAMQLLHRLGNEYEPIKLFRKSRK